MSRLHVDSVTKTFHEKKILQDIFLSCDVGEIVGLLGRNGTGKSTLLKIIFGVVPADYSFIRFGEKVMKTQWDRKNNIAYLPQYSFLPKNIKIAQLAKLFCKENHQNSELLDRFSEEKIKNLSAGEARLIEILFIIYSDAKIALLDEPFHSLSPKIISIIKEEIKKLKTEKGFIISDHQYNDVLEISDKNVLLVNRSLQVIKDLTDLKFHKYIFVKNRSLKIIFVALN